MTGGRAIIVGASIAGLLAARALSDHCGEVVVLERESLPSTPVPRGHVPQGRHLHLLLAAGLDTLVAWFPGITDELESLGAVPVDGSAAWVHQGGAYRAQGDWGRAVLCQTRPLLEQVLRGRVAGLSGVRIETGVRADDVRVAGARVRGLVVQGAVWPADLVVDASGRSSRLVAGLARDHILEPPVTKVGIDIGYASCLMRRSATDFEGSFVVCHQEGTLRGGAVLPIEPDGAGDRWQVTLTGVHGDGPPADRAGFVEFARSLPSPVVAQLIEHCEQLSPIETYRFPSSQRRHFEKVAPLPGLVFVGDSACSFDPVYGQGMTSAALQAVVLGQVVASVGVGSADLPKRFHRKAARVIDAPWQIAVGGDFVHPATVGPRPPLSKQSNRWVRQVIRAGHTSVPVAQAFNRVLQLKEPPLTLMSPAVVGRTLVAARRSPVVTGEPVHHPRVGGL